MSHEPHYRFQSAAEFADAIWDAAESSGIKLAQPKQVRQLLESLPELFILPNHEAALADALITTAPAANDPLKKPAKKKLTIHSGANSVPIANDFETELTEKRPSAFFTDAEKFEFLDEISEGHSFHIDPFASFIQAEAAEKQTRESRPGEDDTLIIVAQQNLNHEELSKALELSLARIHLADLAQLNDQLRVARVPSLRPNAVAITALSPKQLLELGNKASPSSEFSIQEASVHAPPINFSPQSATKPSILSPDELSPRSSQPSIEICPTVDLVVPDLTATEFNPNDITEPSFNSNSEPMLSRFLPTSLLAIATLALALFAIWIWN